MTEQERLDILNGAKKFFREIIASRHIENTRKLNDLSEFNVNPFLLLYNANYLTGNNDAKSVAKSLIYPRVLGTSINTSFGTQFQYFISNTLSGYASAIQGLDIEFVDQIDSRRKYCQLKAGPNTINKDDVQTIINHFNGVRNLARTNRLSIGLDDLVVGVLYGNVEELSTHYKRINEQYPVIVGREFWHRLTGREDFYMELINAIGEVAIEVDGSDLLDQVIDQLAEQIREKWGYK